MYATHAKHLCFCTFKVHLRICAGNNALINSTHLLWHVLLVYPLVIYVGALLTVSPVSMGLLMKDDALVAVLTALFWLESMLPNNVSTVINSVLHVLMSLTNAHHVPSTVTCWSTLINVLNNVQKGPTCWQSLSHANPVRVHVKAAPMELSVPSVLEGLT